MKLVDEEEKNPSCNGNGIVDVQIKKMISSEPPKVTSNGEVHSDDSRSNSESINGAGDLLIEDQNKVKNGTEDITFQNGNKPDDTRSWSSNSSNFPPPDIDEDLSDEMTLRLSDEEEESENTPESTETKKDNIQLRSSLLPTADECSLSNKNSFAKLIDEDKPSVNTENKSSSEENTNEVDEVKKSSLMSKINISPENSSSEENKKDELTKSSHELETLMSEIMPPETAIIDTVNDKSVTELREEMEELLKSDNSEDISQINDPTKDRIDVKDEEISDIDLNSSISTVDLDFPNDEEPSSKSNEESSKLQALAEATTETNGKEDIQGNDKEIVEKSKDDTTNNQELMETAEISEDNSKIDNEDDTVVESKGKCNENNVNIDATGVSTESNVSDMVVDKSDSISDNVSSENNKQNKEEIEKKTIDDDLRTSTNNDDLNDSEINSSELNTISESMELENNKVANKTSNTTAEEVKNAEKVVNEPMEIDSNNDINNIENVQKTDDLTGMHVNSEDINNHALVTSKNDTLATPKKEEILPTLEVDTDMKQEDSKGTVEDNTKSLKRSLDTDAVEIEAKKPKILLKTCEKKDYVPMNFLRDLFAKKEIKSLTREELEELCVQKMCESINQTSKVGELNRLVKQQEQMIESLRTKYNGLKKQIGDISIVQNKMLLEVRTAKAKDGSNVNVMPVKITRSVGLQVSLQTTSRIRSIPQSPEQLIAAPLQKRKIQRISLPNKMPSAQTPITPVTPAKPISATIPKQTNANPTLSKGIKTILPRTYSGPESNKDVTSSTNSLLGNYLTNSTPTKPVTSNIARKTITPSNTVSSTAQTPTTTTGNAAKVIDLTDEDDVAKSMPAIPSTPAGIRVVAPHQLNNTTSTAVTSQMQRVTYLVSPGQQGQVLLATTTAPTRPGGPRSTIMFKPVQGQVQNGQRLNFVRPNTPTIAVLPTSTAQIRPNQQIRFQTASGTTVNSNRPQMISSTRITSSLRHPAPLPGPPAVQPSQPTWKAMPPKPSLKISRVGDGIVLSWKMLNKDMSLYEDIASYQLYAYQETNAAPSTDMWRKVGDVKALALPMACTLTQFTDGNKYHFAVRAVDVKSRVGPFSQPEQIALP